MHYTFHQLQVFLKVSQTRSITKAAEELHLTQPAVSIQLKNLQDQFSIPLTEVIGRQIYITDFGKEIAETAEKILNEVYAINYKATAFKGSLSGRLKISVVSTGKYVIPYFLAQFMNEHKGVELLLDVTNKVKVIESLEKNEIDFALVSILPDKMNIEKVELLQNKLFLVGPKSHKNPNMNLNKKKLAELPLIFREKGSGTRHTMEKFIEKNNIMVSKQMELTSNEAVKQAIIAGLGYSIMPLIGLKNELSNGDLQIINASGLPIKTTWNLIWLKSKKLSPVANAYLTHIKRNKSQIINTTFNWFEQYV